MVAGVDIKFDRGHLNSDLWDSTGAHEFYHALDYLTGQTPQNFNSPSHDPLGMGYSRPSVDRPGRDSMENRASRFAGESINRGNRQPGNRVPQ